MQKEAWLKSYPKRVPAEIKLDAYLSLPEVLKKAVEDYPKHTAFMNMGIRMTYKELDTLTLKFASFFQNTWGLKKGDRIAIQMPNLLQYPVVLFAALRAGLVVVNTNPLYTPREMKHQLEDSGAIAIVILAQFASKLQEILPDLKLRHVMVTEVGDLFPLPKRFIVNSYLKFIDKSIPAYHLPHVSFREALGSSASHFEKVSLNQDDLAFLQYTGGTTGLSKGAMLSHGNIIANMEQISEWIKPGLIPGKEVIITALPLYHVFSLTVNCLGMFKQGMTNVLITNPRDISGLINDIKKSEPTVMTVVSTLLGGLMDHPKFKTLNLKRLKLSVAGGMALNQTVATRWKGLTGTTVIEGYGLTEASPVLTCNPLGGGDRLGSIGLPLPSTEIKILGDDGKEVKDGTEGELCAKGPQVMKGYWNHPEETKAVLTKAGWLKTGDIGLVDADGYFRIVDRKKDMILVSGFNVYPTEIEEVMMRHPDIKEVAAVGVEDPHSGESVKIFVVARTPDLTKEQIVSYAKKQLTGYKVPKHVEFRDELPKTNVGKILRRALRA